jgi:flagellar protein FliT
MSLPSDSALLRHYAALDGASEEMLQAARAGDWDTVCRLEGACAVVIARLRLLGREQTLSPDEQRERMRILRMIVVRDAEIRRICDAVPGYSDPAGWPLVEAGTTIH